MTTATLTVSSASSSDVANYRCVVSDGNGSSTSSEVALSLKAATSITGQPVATNVCAGANVTFGVSATGDGTLAYQWQTNGVNLSDSSHYAGCTNATLWVTNVGNADAVNYRCVVSGGCGSANSGVAELILKGNWVVSLAFSADGRRLISGAGDSTARIWDVESGREIGRVRFPGESSYVEGVGLSPKGDIAFAVVRGMLVVARVAAGE